MPQVRRLERWRHAGLIDDATVARIVAFEEQRRKPWLLYAIGGLGALTVVLGLIAIVASNWADLGVVAKLGADFALLVGLGYAVLRADEGGSAWAREVLLMVFYGLVLASIGLVSQTYHLGGETWHALAFWSLLCAFLVTRGHSSFLATAFYLGLITTWMSFLESAAGYHHRWFSKHLVPGLATIPATLLLLASAWRWLRKVRPAFATAAGALGWLCLAGAMMTVPQLFYARVDGADAEKALPSFLIMLACGLALVAAAPRILDREATEARASRARYVLQAMFGLLLSVLAAAVLVAHDKSGLLAATTFIALWALAGWLAYETGQRRILNAATAIIGGRLIIVYFEVLGSLLSTGLGLLLGGVLTLLLTWVWVRHARRKSPAAPTERVDEGGAQ